MDAGRILILVVLVPGTFLVLVLDKHTACLWCLVECLCLVVNVVNVMLLMDAVCVGELYCWCLMMNVVVVDAVLKNVFVGIWWWMLSCRQWMLYVSENVTVGALWWILWCLMVDDICVGECYCYCLIMNVVVLDGGCCMCWRILLVFCYLIVTFGIWWEILVFGGG